MRCGFKVLLPVLIYLSAISIVFPCSMVLVGKKATDDGSVLLAHNNDLQGDIASRIHIIPGKKHKKGEVVWFGNGLEIPEVHETYRMLIMDCYYGYAEGDAVAINEYHVAIAGGVSLRLDRNDKAERADPLNKNGLNGYIRYVALSRAKTARECVMIVADLYNTYGISYPAGFGIADENEVWYVEAGGGRCWAAVRIPEDCYLAIANSYRIGEIKENDKDNFLCSPGLKDFAHKSGLWNPNEGVFNFAQVFGGKAHPEIPAYNSRRIWRMHMLLSGNQMSKNNIFRKPVHKIKLENLFSMLKDYYQGTPYDVTGKNRLSLNERPIASVKTDHTDVIQLRGGDPGILSAVMWAGLGESLTTVFLPFYPEVDHIPTAFNDTSEENNSAYAYWQFKELSKKVRENFKKNISLISPHLDRFQSNLLEKQLSVEKHVEGLHKIDPEKAKGFLEETITRQCNEALLFLKRLTGELRK